MRKARGESDMFDDPPHPFYGLCLAAADGDVAAYDRIYNYTPDYVVFGALEMKLRARRTPANET